MGQVSGSCGLPTFTGLSNVPMTASSQFEQLIYTRKRLLIFFGVIVDGIWYIKLNPIFSAPQCGHSTMSEGMLLPLFSRLSRPDEKYISGRSKSTSVGQSGFGLRQGEREGELPLASAWNT